MVKSMSKKQKERALDRLLGIAPHGKPFKREEKDREF